jgi:hypothetical protein
VEVGGKKEAAKRAIAVAESAAKRALKSISR